MMRKLLSSSNALMIAILVMLAGIALWAVFASDKDPVATSQTEEPSARQSSPALGGGPPEEAGAPDDEASVDLDTPQLDESLEESPDLEQPAVDPSDMAQPQLDKPRLDEPQLDKPQLDNSPIELPRGEQVEADETPRERTEQSQRAWEPSPDQQADPTESDEMDQEAAFRSDEAPEAEVIGVRPADSDGRDDEQAQSREGGGPIDERDDVEREAEDISEENEEPVDGAGDAPAGVEGESDVVREADQEDRGDADEDLPSEEQSVEDPEVQGPVDDPATDGSTIERPGLRSAPRPSRPGDEVE